MAEGIPYSMYNNSFSYIEKFDRAQELAHRALSKKLSDSFDGMVRKINCLLPLSRRCSATHTTGVWINASLQLTLISKAGKA